MKRKVIQIAKSTQLISLPRQWAKRYNILKGEELEVEEQGDKIIVSTGKATSIVNKKEIDVTNIMPIAQRVLHALYKRGYDEVIVKYSSPETLTILQNMLQKEIIGYEIVEQKADQCTIRAVAGGRDKEFDSILRRTFILLKSFLDGIAESIENEDISRISTLRMMESNNNKYTGFCRRIINKGGIQEHWKAAIMYTLVEELEKIADECKYVCDYISESKNNVKKANKKIKALYRELSELFEGCHILYYTPDLTKISACMVKRKKMIKRIQQFLDKPCEQSRFAHYLMTMTQKMANVLSFEMELNL